MPTLNQLVKGLRMAKTHWAKTPAFEGAPQRRGVCYKIAIVTPRKPNSARRKIAKVRLSYNKRRVFANIPGQGHNLQEYSVVMVEGHGPKDLPGVNYALMRGLLDFVGKESFERRKRRSKFGVKKKV